MQCIPAGAVHSCRTHSVVVTHHERNSLRRRFALSTETPLCRCIAAACHWKGVMRVILKPFPGGTQKVNIHSAKMTLSRMFLASSLIFCSSLSVSARVLLPQTPAAHPISPASAFCMAKTGQFANPCDSGCASFFNCADSIGAVQYCPAGLRFNPQIKVSSVYRGTSFKHLVSVPSL